MAEPLLMAPDLIDTTCPRRWFAGLSGAQLGQGRCMADAELNHLLNLKVAKDRKGMAPNKPLLVLAVLDLVEVGLVGADGLIHKDAELGL